MQLSGKGTLTQVLSCEYCKIFKDFSLGCLVVGSSLIWKKKVKLAEIVTRCHFSSLVVLLVVTHCHSLSFVVVRCHSLSFVVTRCSTHCHSFLLFVTRCTTRLSFYKRSFVYNNFNKFRWWYYLYTSLLEMIPILEKLEKGIKNIFD